jgi:HK97 family phage prohead protease
MGTIELRGLSTELRASNDSGEKRIAGYAATFNTETEIGAPVSLGGNFRERIDPHCFDRAISSVDCDARCLFNHSPDQVLGRTPKTMKLSVDDRGLRYAVKLPASVLGDSVFEAVRRGDISGSSFGFGCLKDAWNGNTRTLLDVDLYDCGPVTYPAYQNTSVQVRSASGATTMVQLAWYKAASKLRLPLSEAEIRSKMRKLRQEMMGGENDDDDNGFLCTCPCQSCSVDHDCVGCDCEGCASEECQSNDSEDCRCAVSRSTEGKMKSQGRTIYPIDREQLQRDMELEQRLFDARQQMKWRR